MGQLAFYSVCMVGAAALAALLLRRYADPRRVTVVVLAVAWYAWLVSLSVVALVPLDVYTTLTGTNVGDVIVILWKVSYWSTQALTWAIIPIIQGYGTYYAILYRYKGFLTLPHSLSFFLSPLRGLHRQWPLTLRFTPSVAVLAGRRGAGCGGYNAGSRLG
jgi:hypothetical protein